VRLKFILPGCEKQDADGLPIKYHGKEIGQILDVEETGEGLIVTGEIFDLGPDFEGLFKPPLDVFSLGPLFSLPEPTKSITEALEKGVDPFPSDHGLMPAYAKADVKATMSLYGIEHKEKKMGSAKWVLYGIVAFMAIFIVGLAVYLGFVRG